MTRTRSGAAALFALSSAIFASAQPPPRFPTAVEAIRVDVLVTDDGRPVAGLGPGDFEVRDNGVVQDVAFVRSEKLPVNMILALDASASMSGEPLERLRGAGRTLLARLQPDDQAALVTFSQQVVLRQGLTRDVARVGQALGEVEPRGETAVIDGSYAAMVLAEAEVGRDLLIVFSDGVDTASWLTEGQALEAARRADVVVYGVSVRGKDRPDFLKELTRLTGGSLLEVDSTRDVGGAFLRVLDEFRSRYLISYSPQGVAGEGWHELKVAVKGRRVSVKARAGYMARR